MDDNFASIVLFVEAGPLLITSKRRLLTRLLTRLWKLCHSCSLLPQKKQNKQLIWRNLKRSVQVFSNAKCSAISGSLVIAFGDCVLLSKFKEQSVFASVSDLGNNSYLYSNFVRSETSACESNESSLESVNCTASVRGCSGCF